MNAWDFPAVIPAYTSASVYVEFDEDITKDPFDDAGEANYEIVREAFPPMTMKFQFAVTFRNLLMRLLDNEPGVKLVNAAISPKTAAPGSVGAPRFEIDLGWRHNDSVVFVLVGSSAKFNLDTVARWSKRWERS
ncbi:hypothetical protein C8Q73DRAFT_690021 [Cubamyces lactineus]|nr:hypothetical protein C8Q73DRAFT_690021 [Cubamyces lactineus]